MHQILRKELLSWKDDDEQIWNYQCNNKELLKADELSRYMKKINKSEVWKSEAHDCYRKFIYNPSKKEPLIQGKIFEHKSTRIVNMIYKKNVFNIACPFKFNSSDIFKNK